MEKEWRNKEEEGNKNDESWMRKRTRREKSKEVRQECENPLFVPLSILTLDSSLI